MNMGKKKKKSHKKKAEKPAYKATIRRKAGNAKKHKGKATLPSGVVVQVVVKKDTRKQRKSRRKSKK